MLDESESDEAGHGSHSLVPRLRVVHNLRGLGPQLAWLRGDGKGLDCGCSEVGEALMVLLWVPWLLDPRDIDSESLPVNAGGSHLLSGDGELDGGRGGPLVYWQQEKGGA